MRIILIHKQNQRRREIFWIRKRIKTELGSRNRYLFKKLLGANRYANRVHNEELFKGLVVVLKYENR
jgi:hypothetical protein